ncbi:diacylglycerol kinase family protein [Corynebacterium felinum]|uniref:Diacylglycerol kinase family enzyme n=1 Tax=Corynebacterium felinum TaxID=131318 RepID=A0ABU2B7H6_9CORY|nr:diacylglycerol kinase family protein [Corynebacterium felinum]MDF5821680.1 diacylglycerol kinase family protein [Corynebacterium felinum]MDR7353728.1 diacylglycerol kinase family enzyme [Corynebacterium felinum]WJY95907.1 Diacylglycerol kinase [Corynebacterium felinum]
MKVLLIANPNSTTQHDGLFRMVIPTLRSVPGLRLHAQFTHEAGHARRMCEGLTRKQWDVVIAVGGDGTVNEVINGLLSSGLDAHSIPAVGVIPTGSANVFARALGFPPEAVQAAEVLASTLALNLRRTIGLGTWDEKWFAVNAGFGLDADVIANMERARRRGFSATPLRYLRVAWRAWRRVRQYPPSIQVHAKNPSGAVVSEKRLPIVMASNTNPWTFLGPLPVVTNPRNSFDVGLSLFGLRSVDGVVGVLAVLQMLGANLISPLRRWIHSRTFTFDDSHEVELVCAQPLRFQVDGEYAGEFDRVRLGAVPDAIEVLCPTEPVPATPESIVRLILSFFDIRI